MPTVINGVGTWYYGKRNIHSIKSTCEFCNRVAVLDSYDTTLYFVVVFVPIIPLSKKRIINQCPSCQKHRLLSLSKWEKIKADSLKETLQKLTENPHDSDAISAALITASSFQDEKLFDRLIALSEDKTGDAKVQAALGSAYGYFSRRDEAIEALKNSLRAQDNPAVREMLAENYLRRGEPENARPLYQHVFDERKGESLWLAQQAIETCQGLGRHADALEIMDARDAAFPDLAKQKPLLKQRAQSEKLKDSNKKLRTAHMIDNNRVGSREGSAWGAKLALILFPILLLVGLIGYVGAAAWKGSHRTIYLVNGTPIGYEVNVNGAKVFLPANQAREFAVPEGEVVVETPAPELGFEPVKATIQTDFWGRPFDGTVFAFNPDRMGKLIEETTTYAVNNPPMNPPPVVHIGEGYYRLPAPDYAFQPFPSELNLGKHTKTVTKKRVGLEPIQNGIGLWAALVQAGADDKRLTELIERRLIMEPDDLMLLSLLSTKLNSEGMIEFLKTGLSALPIRVEWHRLYQTLRYKQKTDKELRTEYEKLAKESSDPEAKYLLARIVEDPESRQLMDSAAAANPPSVYAEYALGIRELSAGHFSKAVQWLDKAYAAKPNHYQFIHVRRDALLADKQFDRILGEPSSPFPSLSDGITPLKIQAAIGKGDNQQLKILLNSLQENGTGATRPKAPVLKSKTTEALLAAIRGDARAYTIASLAATPGESFETLFLQAKFNEAAKIAAVKESPDFLAQRALLYVAAKKANNQALADTAWTELLASMEGMNPNMTLFSRTLQSHAEDAGERLMELDIDHSQKRVLLLVAAERFPKSRDKLLSLAATLNFNADAVSLCIKQLTAKSFKK